MKNIIILSTLIVSTSLFANINLNCFSSLFTIGDTLQLRMNGASTSIVWADKSKLIFGTKITSKNSNDFKQQKIANKTLYTFFDSKETKNTLYVSITTKQYKKFLTGKRFSVSAYIKNQSGSTYNSRKKFKCDN